MNRPFLYDAIGGKKATVRRDRHSDPILFTNPTNANVRPSVFCLKCIFTRFIKIANQQNANNLYSNI